MQSEKKVITIISELDVLESLSTSKVSDLGRNGYSLEEIDVIKNYRDAYDKQIRDFKTESDSKLFNLGYNDTQIGIIRDYNGIDGQMQALASSLTLSLTSSGVLWNATESKSQSNLMASFTWSSVPLIRFTDGVGFLWNDWMRSSYSGTVNYKRVSNGTTFKLTPEFVNISYPAAMGCGFKFACCQDPYDDWLTSGILNVNLYCSNLKKDLSGYAAYGHTTLSGAPNFSLPGGATIDFGISTQTAGQDWCTRPAPK